MSVHFVCVLQRDEAARIGAGQRSTNGKEGTNPSQTTERRQGPSRVERSRGVELMMGPRTAEYRSYASRRRLPMMFPLNLVEESFAVHDVVVCAYASMYVRVYVCMSVCMYVRMYGSISCMRTLFVRACVSSMGSKAQLQRPQQARTKIGGQANSKVKIG